MMLFNFLFFLVSTRFNRNIYIIKTNLISNTNFLSRLYNNSNELHIIKHKNKNNTDGFDMRKINNDTDINFHALFIKKQLLDNLLNYDLSILNKLELLSDDKIKPLNLLASGLFKDWNF